MKRRNLTQLALLGLAHGLLLNSQIDAATADKGASKATTYKEVDPNSENMNYHLMTEDELLLELDDNGVKLYQSLTPEGKKIAREVASQSCNGTNICKGYNACQTEKNACAGQGACKGQSKCAHADKNVAVRLVAEKMAAKRGAALHK